MGAAAKLKQIHQVRKRNLNTVIKVQFGGNASEAARAIERSHTFMWQLVGGYRGIGEAIARHIEDKLDLPKNHLDKSDEGPTKRLPLVDTNGVVKNYLVVPVFKLVPFSTSAVDVVACPLPTYPADAKLFSAVIEAEDVVELRKGDRIFVDRGDTTPVAKQLYVVIPKGTKEACVLIARKADKFGGTGDGARVEYTSKNVTVVGRLVLIVRELPL